MSIPVMIPSALAPLELALLFDKIDVQTIVFLLNVLFESVPESSFCATMLCMGIFLFSRLETGENTVPGFCGMIATPSAPPEDVVQQDTTLCWKNFCKAYLRWPCQVHVTAPKLCSSAVEGSLLIDLKEEDRRFSERAPRFVDDCSKYSCMSKESDTEASKLSVNFNDKGRSKKRKIDQLGVIATIIEEDSDDAGNEDVEGDEEDDDDEKNAYSDNEEGSDEEASDNDDYGEPGEKDEAEEEENEDDDNDDEGGDDDDEDDDNDDDDDEDDDGDDDDDDDDEGEQEDEPPKKRKK